MRNPFNLWSPKGESEVDDVAFSCFAFDLSEGEDDEEDDGDFDPIEFS